MYEFPKITNISQVLPHVLGQNEFVVAPRDGFTVINYNIQTPKTFPPIDDSVKNKILRECRGITFCSKTGNVLARKYHKFFNVNEREETLIYNIDWDEPHTILSKHDGSMITPVMIKNSLEWHTKMGNTDVAQPVYKFVEENPNYRSAALSIIAEGSTPIFEWCSRKQKIVLDYPEDRLILTAIRNNETGEYFSIPEMEKISQNYGLDLVEFYKSDQPISDFLDMVRDDVNPIEGYVIRFNSGHMIKVKTDLYVKIHKAKEKILHERNVVEMIFNNTLDDVKSHLPHEDRLNIENFEMEFSQNVARICSEISERYVGLNGMSPKDFAMTGSVGLVPETRSIILCLIRDGNTNRVHDYVYKTISKNIGRNSNYNNLKSSWKF